MEVHSDAFPRWYLSCTVDAAGNEIDPRIFTEGRFVGAQPEITVPVGQNGPVYDCNIGAFGMIVLPAHIHCRYVDAVGKNAEGRVVEMHQVGGQTGAGKSVAREVKALDDIQGATKMRPKFHP